MVLAQLFNDSLQIIFTTSVLSYLFLGFLFFYVIGLFWALFANYAYPDELGSPMLDLAFSAVSIYVMYLVNKMIDKLIANINSGAPVKVVITTCASKDPTGGKVYKNNGELAHARAVETELQIRKSLKAKGVDFSKVEFRVFFKVRGPEYQGDYIENREAYEQFQYAKVYLK